MTQTILDYLNVTSDDFLLWQILTILIIVRAKWLPCLRVCFLRPVSASVLLVFVGGVFEQKYIYAIVTTLPLVPSILSFKCISKQTGMNNFDFWKYSLNSILYSALNKEAISEKISDTSWLRNRQSSYITPFPFVRMRRVFLALDKTDVLSLVYWVWTKKM